jgi:hypothetical protein
VAGLFDRIRSVFRPAREPFSPLGLGPPIADFDIRHSSFVVSSGPLSGTRLRLDATVQPGRADFSLFPAAQVDNRQSAIVDSSSPRPSGRPPIDNRQSAIVDSSSPLAHCHYDRDPGGTETLWDIVVHPDHRGRGLAALIIRLSLRRLLLFDRGRAWFTIRKLMQVEASRHSPSAAGLSPFTGVRLQNVGVGIIANRLGLGPEPRLETMLSPSNVASVTVVPAEDGSPPGYLFRLNSLPGLLVLCLLDPRTLRPLQDEAEYRRFLTPAALCRAARTGTALVGNVDYELTERGADRLCRHLADSAGEYRLLLRRLRKPGRN